MRTDRGFTLIETLIAMTIMAMVVAVLYGAFSTAAMTWKRQEVMTDDMERISAAARLFSGDMEEIRPYDFHWRGVDMEFFSASRRAIFYVTGNGFGCVESRGGGLYFACLYLEEGENNTDTLKLCKVNKPYEWFVQELHNFDTDTDAKRDSFEPPDEIADRSVAVVEGLREASFSFGISRLMDSAGLPSGSSFADLSAGQVLEGGTGLFLDGWKREGIPEELGFVCEFTGQKFSITAAPRLDADMVGE